MLELTQSTSPTDKLFLNNLISSIIVVSPDYFLTHFIHYIVNVTWLDILYCNRFSYCVILDLLKDRLHPPEPVSLFVKDKTSDELKNQICSITIRFFKEIYRNNYPGFAHHLDKALECANENWIVSRCIPYYISDRSYADLTLKKLNELSDYDYYEFLDVVIFSLSDSQINYHPSFADYLNDIDSSLRKHGVDYTIVNGHLCPRTEQLVFEKTISPCLYGLRDKKFINADEFLKQSFQAYRDSNNNAAIEYAAKALENVAKVICDAYNVKIDDPPKLNSMIDKLIKKTNYNISINFKEKNAQMEKIFQSAMSIRNMCAHGSKPFMADNGITEYMINLVCADILFLIRTFPINIK